LIGYSFAAKNSANTNNTTTNAPQLNPDQVTSPKDNNTTASNRDKVSTSYNTFAELYVRSVAVVLDLTIYDQQVLITEKEDEIKKIGKYIFVLTVCSI
jgi:hypothetical protein